MRIAIILGTARERGVGHRVAKWITDTASTDERFEVDFVDTATLNLPFFNEDFGPKYRHYSGAEYTNPEGKAWAERVAQAEAFLFITPEYNHSTSAILKNALDWVGPEWSGKPVGLVGYSITSFGGARAIEHLRQIAPELGLHQVREALLISTAQEVISEEGKPKVQELDTPLKTLLDEVYDLGTKLA